MKLLASLIILEEHQLASRQYMVEIDKEDQIAANASLFTHLILDTFMSSCQTTVAIMRTI